MKLTILGCSAAYPGPGGACSGYLVEDGDTRLLVDCGTGVLSNLQRVVAIKDVTHIVISHLHADHFLDLIPYRYALTRLLHEALHTLLYLPPGGVEGLLKAVSAFDTSPTFFSDLFQIEEYDPAAALRMVDLTIEFAAVKHYIPSYAMAISGSKRMVYSADSGLCDELAELARGSDLFLCEATRCQAEDGEWGHLLASETGALARKAEAKRLVLTHFWPDCDYSQSLEQATTAFGKAVEVAEEFRTYIL